MICFDRRLTAYQPRKVKSGLCEDCTIPEKFVEAVGSLLANPSKNILEAGVSQGFAIVGSGIFQSRQQGAVSTGRQLACPTFASIRVIRGQKPRISARRRNWRASRPRYPQTKLTGSISTVSETSSGSASVSSDFASDSLSLLICRVRSISW